MKFLIYAATSSHANLPEFKFRSKLFYAQFAIKKVLTHLRAVVYASNANKDDKLQITRGFYEGDEFQFFCFYFVNNPCKTKQLATPDDTRSAGFFNSKFEACF
jgi:hypothetical protein